MGWEGRWKKLPSEDMDPQVISTLQPYPVDITVKLQVNTIHLVCFVGTIVSVSHLHDVKACPQKSRSVNSGDWMHNLMIAIEYSYKLGRK